MSLKKKFSHLTGIACLVSCLAAATLQAAEDAWDNTAKQLQTLGLPAVSVDILVKQAQARGLGPADVAVWQRIMTNAHQQGISVGLIAERIAQGLVKGVPSARLTEAAQSLEKNLVWTKQVLEKHLAPSDGADSPKAREETARNFEAALRAGMERHQMEKMLESNSLTIAQASSLAKLAANLRSWGVEAKEVARISSEAGRANVKVEDIANMEQKFVAGMREGRAAQALLLDMREDMNGLMDRSNNFESPGQQDLRMNMKQDMDMDMRQDMKQDAQQEMHDVSPAGQTGGSVTPDTQGGSEWR